MPPTRPFYVTDTHPFVWYLAADDDRLSPGAKSVFENADSAKAVVVIPAIVLAESLYLAEKRSDQSQGRRDSRIGGECAELQIIPSGLVGHPDCVGAEEDT